MPHISMRRTIFAFCQLLCIAGLCQLQAQQAQTGTGTITGTVLDQAGKSVPDAGITVKNEAGSLVAAATTSTDGRFSAGGLAPGSYTVETSSPGFALNTRRDVPVSANAPADISITLFVDSISQSVTVQETVSLAADLAPMGNSLETITAQTTISSSVIQNLMTPQGDFAEVIEQAPGSFSVNPNGIGLGQGKSFFRGFADGNYGITFDGIPFGDTNDGTHHSWASFPAQWISSTDIVRSPGLVSQFGPNNFGGNVDLKSPELQADPNIRGTVSRGSWNTQIYAIDFESGLFGPGKKEAILFNINHLTSDGYQTYNYQQRDAGYAKFQHRFNPTTTLTLYSGVVIIRNNTPDTTNPQRKQVALNGLNYLMDNTPICLTTNAFCTQGQPDGYYFGYEGYHVQTDFEYAAFSSDLGDGWKFDEKLYTTRYWNKQFLVTNFSIPYPISTSSPTGVDKLNGYRHAGDETIMSKETKWGVFRFGAWYDWAYTDRYQIPSNPVTQQDTPLGLFHEKFISQTFEPFAEFQWNPTPRLIVTLGIKPSDYAITLNQYQDNGKTVGCLGGTLAKYPLTGAPICLGGAQFVRNSANYLSWLPNAAARYRLTSFWSAYAHFAEGFRFPVAKTFDVTGGIIETKPKATIAKAYEVGSVLKRNRWTLDVDAYYTHYQNAYDSYTDLVTLEPVYIAVGPSNTKGIEAEGNIAFGHGFSLYGNASFISAKYQEGKGYPNGGLWVQNTPDHVFGFDPLWTHSNWDVGVTEKVIGRYYNDNGNISYIINGLKLPYPADMAVKISQWDLTNFFVSYRIKNVSKLRGSKIQFAINNLANHHSIIGITPAVGATTAALFVPNGGDLLNLLPARSYTISITGGWAPRR